MTGILNRSAPLSIAVAVFLAAGSANSIPPPAVLPTCDAGTVVNTYIHAPKEQKSYFQLAAADASNPAAGGEAALGRQDFPQVESFRREFEARIAEVSARADGYKAAFETMKIVGTIFGILITLIAGVFAYIGWSNFKDIKSSVATAAQEEVFKAVKYNRESFDSLIERMASTERLISEFKSHHDEIISIAGNLKAAENLNYSDALGQFELLMVEQKRRGMKTVLYKKGLNVDVSETTLDLSWRAQAYGTLMTMAKGADEKWYDPNSVYNASVAADRLEFHDLASRLAEQALRLEDIPGHRARALRFRATGGDRSATAELLGMVRTASLANFEIVLAETWNIAERTRSFLPFINAISDRVALSETEPDDYVPSYAHALKAFALLRAGRPGNVDDARREIELAKNKLQSEPAIASWVSESIEQIKKVESVLNDEEGGDEGGLDSLLEKFAAMAQMQDSSADS